MLVDEGAALDEEVLLFGVGDGALLEEGDLSGELFLGLLGLFDLCGEFGDFDVFGVELSLEGFLSLFASIESLLHLYTLIFLVLKLISPQDLLILSQVQLFLQLLTLLIQMLKFLSLLLALRLLLETGLGEDCQLLVETTALLFREGQFGLER